MTNKWGGGGIINKKKICAEVARVEQRQTYAM